MLEKMLTPSRIAEIDGISALQNRRTSSAKNNKAYFEIKKSNHS